MSNGGSADAGRRTKVGRLIERYDLVGMPERLERYWRGDGVERHSLRELATLFNERLVRAAMIEAGANPLEGEAANRYALLTGEEATSGARTRAERRLDREGVDVASLRESFVSHQAIHTYLTTVREQEYEAEAAGVEDRIETVNRLVGRTRSVADDAVDALDRADEIGVGDADVSVDVRVTCRDCNERYDLTTMLRCGGCACGE
ncbi:hypothetical protein JCM30237_23100 [Halolamina litorea]|uniref:rod-determining factor RdfA n=1 Tax=Halolamina litorea TaxID=1515593 RepID=UPI00226E2E31|nr:rod-determining factor RdfA [Halolamina litorea]